MIDTSKMISTPHESEVRPLVAVGGRALVCVRNHSTNQYLVRFAAPAPSGETRHGHRQHATEDAAVADYDAMVTKLMAAQ